MPDQPKPDPQQEQESAAQRLAAAADEVSVWDPNKNQWVPIVEKKI